MWIHSREFSDDVDRGDALRGCVVGGVIVVPFWLTIAAALWMCLS